MTIVTRKSFPAIKGFNKDWTCRGYQFEVGKKYHQNSITHVWAGITGKDGIEPGQWYTLDDSGHPMIDTSKGE